ncbi:hypothetical protein Bbelb_384470 [Branchiostoma belcheri]|nr:hypothetical protein Bbelb_384470 [Branchiostoma belcheri]
MSDNVAYTMRCLVGLLVVLTSDAFTANAQWQDVFTTLKGTGQTVYDAWSTNGQVSHNKCPVVDQWESLNIQRAKVVLETSEGNVELIFNGTNTDKFSWFSKSRLLSSPWNDISTEPQNFFSIEGLSHAKRSFYISRNHGGCPQDAGWLAVADGGPLGHCEWDRAPEDQLPYIRFSKTTGYANYNGGNIATADRMVIYIDTPGNNALCSCPAGQSLSEDGTRCEATTTTATTTTPAVTTTTPAGTTTTPAVTTTTPAVTNATPAGTTTTPAVTTTTPAVTTATPAGTTTTPAGTTTTSAVTTATPAVTTTTPAITTVSTTRSSNDASIVTTTMSQPEDPTSPPPTASLTTSRLGEGGSAAANKGGAPGGSVAGGVTGAMVLVGAGIAIGGFLLYRKKKKVAVEPTPSERAESS